MTTIDMLILLCIGGGAVWGFFKGFISQLATILGFIAGLIAAKTLYAALAVHLCPSVTESMTVAQVLAFIIIWMVVPLAFIFAAFLLTKAVEAVSLGWLNRWLGSGLGALQALLLVSLIIGIIQFVDSKDKLIGATKKRESLLYYSVESFAGIFFPMAEHVANHYIEQQGEQNATGRTQ